MIELCPLGDLVAGTVTRVAPPGLPAALALVRIGDRVFCIDDTCSHETASLSDGWLAGYQIECPLHESRFDLRTGAPDCPPARRPVRVYDVVVVNGMVCVEAEGTA
ncbi:non-heme iron oxygenase ferredoxin subunit [Sinosporangium siamense]|uniref:Bifunctional 3-phenylpropionate/cinnamic acid dioxygenase ferredoxin subunit n=1 Tax=Sinosporangium siamense TaxID=1367973 RepID=A0A919RN23_9ACTN|nr:non-heme iron oxygenase ferredoxin subunit [Sinosporangium siamense]GII95201.1 bifunctional 3-phenylpropionate/cinnamic acid dioxygenase ferredoxin subunit [Sinosporangium siamense]